MPSQTWKNGILIARQTAWDTPKTNYLPRHLGGDYTHLPSTGTITPTYDYPKILPQGASGQRDAYVYPVEEGRKEVEISFSALTTMDTIPFFLYGALGAISSTPTADAGNPLATAVDLSSGVFTLSSAPTTSAILVFTFTTLVTSGGTDGQLTIVGTDANGTARTEVLTNLADSLTTAYSRFSYTTVTSITPANITSGTVQVDGTVSVSHSITPADTNPIFNIVNTGDHIRTDDTKAGRYDNCILTELVIQFDAEAMDGLVSITGTFRGAAGVEITAPAVVTPTVDRPIAGWRMSVTKDGSSYTPIQSGTITIDPGLVHYRSAVNSQSPQGISYGVRDATMSLQVVKIDASIFTDYVDSEEMVLAMTWSHSQDKLDATTNKSMVTNIYRFAPTSYTAGDNNELEIVTLEGSLIKHATNGIMDFAVVNGVTSY